MTDYEKVLTHFLFLHTYYDLGFKIQQQHGICHLGLEPNANSFLLLYNQQNSFFGGQPPYFLITKRQKAGTHVATNCNSLNQAITHLCARKIQNTNKY